MEKRTEPIVDGTHTLLSVESSDVSLFTRTIQFPYPCTKCEQERYLEHLGFRQNDESEISKGLYATYGTDLVHSVTP